MSLKVDARRMNVFADGRLRLPAGVRERDGCEGKVLVAVFRNGNEVDRKRVNLDRDCEYDAKLEVRREDRHRVRARFLGNDLLRPINAPAKTVNVR
jgi:hypothetical protein